jgi:hypothetical protein
LLDRPRYGQRENPVYPDRGACRDLPGHVCGGGAHDGRDPQPAREPGPNPDHRNVAQELGNHYSPLGPVEHEESLAS